MNAPAGVPVWLGDRIRAAMALWDAAYLPREVSPLGHWVYFLEAAGLDRVKIGVTTDPVARAAQIQTDCPAALVPLLLFRAKPATEAALHRHFAALRTRGEWFRADPPLREYVERIVARRSERLTARPKVAVELDDAVKALQLARRIRLDAPNAGALTIELAILLLRATTPRTEEETP